MGFYLRKSFRAGPIRFNLSKSGIGVSAGVTGARLGMSSTGGAYVHGGRGGLYYRKSLGSGSGRGRAHAAEDGTRQEAASREPIELTEETGATYGIPEQPEQTDAVETPARNGSASGPIVLCLVGAFFLVALLGLIPWAMAVAGSVLSGLGMGVLGIVKAGAIIAALANC